MNVAIVLFVEVVLFVVVVVDDDNVVIVFDEFDVFVTTGVLPLTYIYFSSLSKRVKLLKLLLLFG